MTATILTFPSRDRDHAPCTCPRHSLDALAARVRSVIDGHAGELLVPLEALSEVYADLTSTTDRLLPPSTERTKP
ncbi:MAG: hypothetical protein WA966_01325 [Ornithinimicrobium sp.]